MLGVAFLSDFFNELEGQRPACALVTIDGAAHEDVIRAEECFDVGQRDGSSLIDHDKIGVPNFVGIGRKYVLDELSMGLFDLDSNNGFVVVLGGAVYFFVVESVFVV